MSTRRLATSLVALAAIVSTATPSALPARAKVLPNVAAVARDGRVYVVRGGTATAMPLPGILSLDQRTYLGYERHDGRTTVVWSILASGTELGRVTLPGALAPRATDLTGRWVALTDETRRELVVASADGEVFRKTFATALAPEAVSAAVPPEGETKPRPFLVSVLEYLDAPPSGARQAAYQVRNLDLVSGALGAPRNLKNKAELVEQQMSAEGLDSVYAERDHVLLSMYRGREGAMDKELAFIHTLGLDYHGVWCIDLPSELALLDHPGAMAVPASGGTVYVVSANGALTEIPLNVEQQSPTFLTPARTVQRWTPKDAAVPPAIAVDDQTVVIAQGNDVVWFDRTSLEVSRRTTLKLERVSALAFGELGLLMAHPGGLIVETAPGDLLELPTLQGLDVARLIPLPQTS